MRNLDSIFVVAALALLCGGIAIPARAQGGGNAPAAGAQQPDAEAPGSETIYFLALDSQGKAITDLKAEELEVRVGGAPLKISRLLPPEMEPPLTLQVLLDVSGSRRGQLPGVEQKYAYDFFEALLRPGDRAFVWEFNDGPWLLTSSQDSTDPRALAAEIRSESRLWDSTALFDSILKVCENDPQNGGGRKAMLLVSDGDDNNSGHRDEDVEHVLQRDNLQFFVVNVAPAERAAFPPYTSAEEKREELERARKLFRSFEENAVGGAVLEAATENDFHDALDHILEYLRNEYGVTFTLPTGVSGKKSRRIAIRTSRPGVTIVGPQEIRELR